MRPAFYTRIMLMILPLILLLSNVSGEMKVSFLEGEEWFPDKQHWTYHYTYRIPVIEGEDEVAEELNYYFEGALNEMTALVLPMYAADEIMQGLGSNQVSDDYEITCNNNDYFSVLLHHKQTVDGQIIYTLSSVVFALSGDYQGESLTLRGLASEIGESSAQLSELVVADVERQISSQTQNSRIKGSKEKTLETLTTDFFPETHFYADNQGNIVFYLQPGVLSPDDLPVLFTYSVENLKNLLIKSQ